MDHELFRAPNSVDSTSKDLVNRLKSGDQDSWRMLFKVYGPIVSYWARSGQLPPNDIQDIVQDVFLAVTRSIDQFERADGRAKFRSWLKTITHNKVIDHHRRNGRDPLNHASPERLNDLDAQDCSLGVAVPTDLTEAENAAIVQSVTWAIQEEFEEKTWQAFWRTAVDGRPSSEVAAELGISPDAVRKNKSRVLKRLREVLAMHFG